MNNDKTSVEEVCVGGVGLDVVGSVVDEVVDEDSLGSEAGQESKKSPGPVQIPGIVYRGKTQREKDGERFLEREDRYAEAQKRLDKRDKERELLWFEKEREQPWLERGSSEKEGGEKKQKVSEEPKAKTFWEQKEEARQTLSNLTGVSEQDYMDMEV